MRESLNPINSESLDEWELNSLVYVFASGFCYFCLINFFVHYNMISNVLHASIYGV